jgi:hypothetical protein
MNLSTHAEGLIATWLAGGAAPSPLTTVFLDVHNGDPLEGNTNSTSVYQQLTGVSGRKSITPVSSSFSATGSNVTNIAEILLTLSAVAACTITHFSIWTASTGGSQIYNGAITGNPISILVGNKVSFAIGSIQIIVA